MPVIRVETDIGGPPEVCFDLARSVDVHLHTTRATGEQAVAGVTHGLLSLGDHVTWRARHFGVTQELSIRITAFNRPTHFRDEMVRGAFRHLRHDHWFEKTSVGTRMVDIFDFAAPWGLLGRVADRVVLTRYLRRLLEARAQDLKGLAESAGGRHLIGADSASNAEPS